MGVVIASPLLAQRLVDQLDRDLPRIAWQVRLARDGGLEWVDRAGGAEVRLVEEPQTTAARRAFIRALSAMPIDHLL